jgi:hypothetical protein
MRVWVRVWAVALSAALFSRPLGAQDQGETRPTRSGLVFIPRVDVLVVATVEEDLHCSATGTAFCRPEESAQFEYDDTSRVALGVDALGNLTENLRFGGGLWYVPEARVQNENEFEVEWASDLSLVFIGEGLIDVAEEFALSGRLFAGALAFFPSGYGADAIDAAEDSCAQLRAQGVSCEVTGGPFWGPTLGGGLGVVGSCGRFAWRTDLIGQWYTVPLFSVEAANAGGTLGTSSQATGTRFWLSMGMEL